MTGEEHAVLLVVGAITFVHFLLFAYKMYLDTDLVKTIEQKNFDRMRAERLVRDMLAEGFFDCEERKKNS